ncbi:MAG: cysteine--tRNA ligase [Candidatus Odyssella sp.]|nr:cysteine--tRNA ligase [Candidatus Odyssella sp.]
MTLRLHNTLTRQKEAFVPLDPANVRMYVCGPTVYDRIHIGNARPFVVFDVLFRLLRRQYGAEHVKYARNITDIDDKINNRAKERGIDIAALTVDTTRTFHEDVAALGCLPPTFEPRATGTIAEMQEMIAALIAKGYAYEAQGHVLFHVPAMMERPPLPKHVYGLLSKKNRDDLVAGARIDVAPYKRDPADFVLWKPSTPDLPGWESPWGTPPGRGRPGWHIECSAMSRKHLGETFDIHAGGLDLIFPHHENEIAQSECCNGKPMARYWMHNGFIERGGEKMAKSVGNIDRVRDLLDEFPGEALRLMLLKTHYRSPLEFTKEGLKEAKAQLDHYYRALARVPGVQPSDGAVPISAIGHLEDDLNTPAAITSLHHSAGLALQENNPEILQGAKGSLVAIGGLLGLLNSSPDAWFRWSPKTAASIDEAKITSLIDARLAARKAKNFKEADRIRDELARQGVILEDGPKGTTWRRAG